MTIHDSLISLVGNTPLLKLRGPSEKTGCNILAKCEFLNPGQSVKDRAALWIIRDAEKSGRLQPGGVIVEGTAGNTGIGLCTVGNALGYRCVIVMPETQSQEKKDTLSALGADLHLTPAKPYKDPQNYIRTSERMADEIAAKEHNGAIWANQFDNTANRQAHIESTGPEIWDQTDGKVDAFVSAIGTGGTLSGVGIALKERNKDIKIALADPFGSAMHTWFQTGELKSEGSSISEGIGQGRITKNVEGAPIDMSFQVTDVEMLEEIYGLLLQDGLCVGGSTGINVAGAMKLARELGPGHTIVTLLCDVGTRYQSKIFNPAFLRERNLPVPPWMS
ncbi:MAG: cysteine synthase A [Alphaproteobacteria bacterium]|jgi:cysteine synthase|nr:cysteine synthase A [Rhodospirillaceae bacterium]MBT6202828.1 cysteine synthase A [Rhodospirillaceae bacterium]MBT6511367.1 cysteine synthase A [Rhodospirillaceae bacterium]MBT7615594.1 cysteine synthase A [Rhodospirillaceae bacterium]MDG2480436.1 cysteine synthase A [Alphaproteobacteria bacterium]